MAEHRKKGLRCSKFGTLPLATDSAPKRSQLPVPQPRRSSAQLPAPALLQGGKFDL